MREDLPEQDINPGSCRDACTTRCERPALRWAFPCTGASRRLQRYTGIVKHPAHILASIVTAAVLAATPAIATLCAMLCAPAATAATATAEPAHHDHEHHAAVAADDAGAPMAAAAGKAADTHHRHAAEPAAARTHHGSAPAQLTAQSSHPCCDGGSMTPRALTTRRVDSGAMSAAPAGVAAPLVSFTTVPLAHAPAARPDAHLVSRPPLVLRI